jgi:surface carbohydrate biosynthesis protein (TIGR04326 family)
MPIKSLSVIDGAYNKLSFQETTLYWNGYNNHKNAVSIPEHLERNSHKFRKMYLEFIRNLGETLIEDKKLSSHLEIEDGCSFWWMSLLSEKSTYKSPRIFDCLRLLALEDILLIQNPDRVVVVTRDVQLKRSIAVLCANLCIGFKSQKPPNQIKKELRQKRPSRIPHFLKAIKWIVRNTMIRWPLRRSHDSQEFIRGKSVSFFSYFYHLGKDKKHSELFYSYQWETLPKVLQKSKINSNWFHLFPVSSSIPDPQTGLEMALKFNKNAEENGYHAFLENYLSISTLGKALKYWFKLITLTPRLQKTSNHFRPSGSAVSLWPFLKSDWYSSFYGEVGMQNCLWLSLLNKVMSNLPMQWLGLYLCENQSWEYALLHAWKKYNHGTLIAVPHSTVRYWDLQYFQEFPQLGPGKRNGRLVADLVAVNGKMARSSLTGAVKNTGKIIEVEALRYLYLRDKKKRAVKKNPPNVNIKLIVLGDGTPEKTLNMLRLVSNAISKSDRVIEVTLKLHPACKLDKIEDLFLGIKLKSSSLEQQLLESDIAFCSNNTSASLDAAILGLPVVIMLDGTDFNNSPLRDCDNVKYIKNTTDLVEALASPDKYKPHILVDDIFYLDPKLPRWQNLISSATTKSELN